MILYSNYISLFAITFLIFCPWKKGPDWYLKYSPKIYKTMVYINYVILPALNIGLTIFFTVNPRYDLKALPLESWIIFFTIVCFTRLVEFWSSLRKILFDDMKIYLSARKELFEGRGENLGDPLLSSSNLQESGLFDDPSTEVANTVIEKSQQEKRAMIEL